MSPSSAIQRRCQAPQPNIAATASTLTHRLIRTVASYRNAGQRASRPATVAVARSAEKDCRTQGPDPRDCEKLQHTVTQRDLLRFAGLAAVDVDRVA